MEACRDLCLTAPYRCHSFDYGDTGERVCRLSHHTSTTLTQIQVKESLNSFYYITIYLLFRETLNHKKIETLYRGQKINNCPNCDQLYVVLLSA